MNNLSLSTMNNNNTTTVSNVFIDEFMPLANGEFTKIYLYLLRCISNGKTNISIDCLADFFNQTEADIDILVFPLEIHLKRYKYIF